MIAPIIYFGLSTDVNLDQFTDLLTENEIKRSQSFLKPSDSRRFIISRGILRLIISKHINLPPQLIDISHSTNGKPYLPDFPRLKFNVTHSHGALAIAISSNHNIGVDIEPLARYYNFKKLENVLYSPTEIKDREESFLKVWTLKEALMKSQGIGLSQPLNTIELSSSDNYMKVLSTPWTSTPEITLTTEQKMGYVVSSAVEAKLKPTPITNFDGILN
jgi:4'-phosphopantetheinyl transferase